MTINLNKHTHTHSDLQPKKYCAKLIQTLDEFMCYIYHIVFQLFSFKSLEQIQAHFQFKQFKQNLQHFVAPEYRLPFDFSFQFCVKFYLLFWKWYLCVSVLSVNVIILFYFQI